MKYFKTIVISLFILLFVSFLLRGVLFRHSVYYKAINNRKSHLITNRQLVVFVESGDDICRNQASVPDIIETSLRLTSEKLCFKFKSSSSDPNVLIKKQQTHCVGYASFFVTVCNYLLKKHKISQNWIAEAKVGQIFVLGENVHVYFNSPFFRDHDFVVIKNKQTHEILAVDPTLYEYLGIDYVTVAR